jgi:hypothetical protein
MKKVRILMPFLLAWAVSLSAQTTREQADAIMLNHLQSDLQHEFLYVNVSTPDAEGICITTSNEETFRAKYACWAYYLNESELSQCRYFFVKEDNGNLLEVIANGDAGQSDLTQWKSLDDDTVGVKERNLLICPLIYPNPVDDWLTFSDIGERTLVEIHDLKGARLFSGFLSGEKSNQLDVSFLSAGVYTVSVYGETRVVYKVVKNSKK